MSKITLLCTNFLTEMHSALSFVCSSPPFLRYCTPFEKVLTLMKAMMRSPPVALIFADDDDFISLFVDDVMPNMPVHSTPIHSSTLLPSASCPAPLTSSTTGIGWGSTAHQNSEVIDLLDDD